MGPLTAQLSSALMLDEQTPRNLSERTGKHRCIRCLADVADEKYFANDHLCDECAAEPNSEEERMKDEG